MMLNAINALGRYMPEQFQKVIIRYLIDRYIGEYLVNNVSLPQLKLDITNGKGKISDLDLNIQALNEAAEQFNVPFIFVHAYIEEISFSTNWRKLDIESCFIEITGLKLTLHPKERNGTVSVIDSMVDSMSSSIQMAQDCLSKSAQADCSNANNYKNKKAESKDSFEKENFNSQDVPVAIEQIARFIESFIQNIRVRFVESNIRIENRPTTSDSGIALEFLIEKIDFKDEASCGKEKLDQRKQIDLSSVISKLLFIEGVSIYSNEFSVNSEPDPIDTCVESQYAKTCDLEISDDEFHDTLNIDNSNFTAYNNIYSESENTNTIRNSILLAKLCNKQEVRLQFRKPDSVIGPKTKIDISCGPLIIFASPRQVHLLIELIEGMMAPENVDPPELSSRKPRDIQKPMNGSDFQTLKRGYSKCEPKLNSSPSQTLNNQGGWSSPPDDLFFPFASADNEFRENQNPLLNNTSLTDISDFETSFTSTASSNIYESSHRKDDILKSIKLQLTSFCIVILQDDVMIPSQDTNEIITLSSLKEMHRKVDFFFSYMNSKSESRQNSEEILNLQNKIQGACLDSHLRFIGTAIAFETTEKINAKKWQLNTNIAVGWLEIIECLHESDKDSKNIICNNLLKFEKNDPSTINQLNTLTKHRVQISINKHEMIETSNRLQKISSPQVDVHVTLEDFITEIDISLLDRINVLVNKQNVIRRKEGYIPADKLPPSYLDNQAFFKEIMKDDSKSEITSNIKIESPHISMKVFFPIPDLRPLSDMNRVPWWKRNIRKEVLWINCKGFVFLSKICASYPNNFEIQSNDVQVLFQEADDIPPVPILTALSNEKDKEEYAPVRIDVKSFPIKIPTDFDDELMSNQDMTKSTLGFFSKYNNLFDKNHVLTENQITSEETPVPSKKTTIDGFINETINNVQHDINVILPDVKFILPSKHICEVLYNRIVSDLLLWTPSAPKHVSAMSSMSTVMKDLSIGTTLIPDSYYNASTEFKPFACTENDDFFDNEFPSIYDQPCLNSKKNIKMPSGQTFLTLKLNITDAFGSIHTPYKDENNKLIPGKYGDISFSFEEGLLFIASGYKGDVDAVQGCITLNTIHVYHKSQNDISYSPIKLDSNFPMKQLETVIHPSDFPYKVSTASLLKKEKECVTVCFKSSFDTLKNEKLFEATGTLHCLTLRYFVTNPIESWFCQIRDMLSVEDYPVEGYTLPNSVSEINFHLDRCGIDYRPLNLPLKSYITIDNLGFFCSLTLKSISSVMQFIVDDAALFFSQNLTESKTNLTENYVCILNIGRFELCMKMDYSSLNNLFTEMIFSSNLISLHTCADSFKAFMEFLIYVSGEGDLVKDPLKCAVPANKVVIEPSSTEEIDHSQYNKNALTNQRALIASRMQEAMMESNLHDFSQDALTEKKKDANIDVFCFPGENMKKNANVNMENLNESEVETALREALNEDYTTSIEIDNNLKCMVEDEFCVLDDIPGTGIKSPTGKPKAKLIEHVSFKDDYYGPSPSEYKSRFIHVKDHPQPYYKYILKQMSIKWYMYGGNDFNIDTNGNKLENGDNSNQKGNVHVKKESPKRCQDTLIVVHLNKIKFEYEIFPNECPIASRYIFLINEIEILDCLQCSKIHKFLYQFTCAASPKQASSNMIQVRSITRRCDPVCIYETNLYISCLPIRLNIDQNALLFIIKFIEHLANIDKESEYGVEEKPFNTHQIPVMSLKCNNEASSSQVIYFNNSTIIKKEENPPIRAPMYFRNVVFTHDVPIRIDYIGKSEFDKNLGVAGVLIGMGELKNCEVTLKKIHFKSGILGFSKVLNSLMNEWVQDLRQNQLPSIIGGVGPMHSLVTLFCGLRDLIWFPIQQYNQGGPIFRGIQRGTSSFTSSSAYAVLDLTARFVGTIQFTAETIYDIVSSGPSVKSKAYKKRKRQPKDIREGVTNAYVLVRNGLGDTASALIKVATEEHAHKGVSGALGGVLRQIPPSVVQPIIIASEATCTVIGGMTNQLVPDAGKEAADKWKS